MRILFMGTPEFAVPCFDVLNSEYEIIGAFTKVDKPNMRGKKIKFTPVKEYALEHNIPVYQPNSLKIEETQNIIKELNPDLIVVVDVYKRQSIQSYSTMHWRLRILSC